MGRRAAFLDRDGTLIVDPGYTGDPNVVEVLPGVAESLRRLEAGGYVLVIVTNQSAIARGYATAVEVEAVNRRVVDLLAAEGVSVAAVYYCPHHPDDGCECRKPQPGMLSQAARELGVDLAQSVMIGDKATDVEAGIAGGCIQSVLIDDDTGVDLAAAVQRILE